MEQRKDMLNTGNDDLGFWGCQTLITIIIVVAIIVVTSVLEATGKFNLFP